MEIGSVASLFGELQQLQLLEASQLEETRQALHGKLVEPRALAAHLVKKGWLTPFQINQLFQGRGEDLVLGSYLLLERQGEGGMGLVYKARHRRMRRLVSLVVVCEELLATPGAVDRFYAEIQAASQLSHPNIVNAYDAGPVGQTHFFAMEYLDGIDLECQVREVGPLQVELACDFICQACHGLHHAWQRGLLHHDLRPANLLATRAVTNQGDDSAGSTLRAQGRTIIKVRNLGLTLLRQLARSRPNEVAQTLPVSTLAAPDYLAPEQASNPLVTDVRSELYSLGACLFFLLAGRPPFPEGTAQEKLQRHLCELAPSIHRFRPEVPPAVEAVIARLLAKDPGQRPQTPAELVEALIPWAQPQPTERTQTRSLAVQSAPTLQAPPSMIVRLARSFTSLNGGGLSAEVRPEKPRRRWVALAVLLLGLVLGAGGLFTLGSWVFSGGGESAAEAELKQLGPVPNDATAYPDFLRRALALRQKYPGTHAAEKVTALVAAVHGPLEDLDESGVPNTERPLIPLKGGLVVGLLGDHSASGLPYQILAVSPEGKNLLGGNLALTRTENQTFRLTNVLTDETVANFDVGVNAYAAQISLDGKMVVFLARLPTGENQARAYRVAAPSEAPVVLGPRPSQSLQLLALSPDAQFLASTGTDRIVRFWDLHTGMEKVATTAPAGGFVQTSQLLYSPDGLSVATASFDRWVRVYDTSNAQERWSFQPPGLPAVLAFSPDSKTLMCCGTDRVGRFFDAMTGKDTGTTLTLPAIGSPGPNLQIMQWPPGFQQACYSPNGKSLVLLGPDPMVGGQTNFLVWDFEGAKIRAQIAGPMGMQWNQHFWLGASADGRWLKTWSQDQSLRLIDLAGGKEPIVLKAPVDHIAVAAVSPTGYSISTGSQDGRVEVWEPERTAMKVQRTLRGHTLAVSSLAYAPDGQSVATGSYDQSICLWDLTRKDSVPASKTHTPTMVTALAFAPKGDAVASGGVDGKVFLWDSANGKQRSTFEGLSGWVSSLAFSPDGKFLAAASEDGGLRLWPVAAPARDRGDCGLNASAVTALAYSPDGKALVAGLATAPFLRPITVSDTTFRVGNVPPTVHSKPVRGLSFSPDGKYLASVGDDSQLVLWKTASWEVVKRYTLSGTIRGVSFAPNGQHLVITNGNGTSYILRLPANYGESS